MSPDTLGSYEPRDHGADCDRCPLRGKRVVPPEGPPDPELVLVGEAPGMQEEKNGRPFFGPSGVKLAQLLLGIRVERRRVWISNAILCRPEIPEAEGRDRFDVKKYLQWLKAGNAARKRAAKEANQERIRAWRAENKSRKAGGLEPLPPPELVEFAEIPTPFACCRARLHNELRRAEAAALKRGDPNGIVVMPLGNFAAEAVTGRSGILKLRGSPMAIDVETFKQIPEGPPNA